MQLTEQQQDKLSKVQLEESWKRSLTPFLLSPYMDSLRDFLFQQKQAQKTIYPPSKQIFNALNITPLDHVKVVILGQRSISWSKSGKWLKFLGSKRGCITTIFT